MKFRSALTIAIGAALLGVAAGTAVSAQDKTVKAKDYIRTGAGES